MARPPLPGSLEMGMLLTSWPSLKQTGQERRYRSLNYTRAALIASCLCSGGHIPYQRIKASDRWLVPDILGLEALVKCGYAVPDDDLKRFVVTEKG